MLTIESQPSRTSRRNLLKVGASVSVGLDLAGLFATRNSQARDDPKPLVKSCILVFCDGGPSHLDTFDMKPHAPAAIRGEFRPIATSVPGHFVCEHLPRTARVMHQLAVVRSMCHRMRGHRSGVTNTLCGLPPPGGDVCDIPAERRQMPSYASRLAYAMKNEARSVAQVMLPYPARDGGFVLPGQSAGFLGAAYQPFQFELDPNALILMSLPAEVTVDRLRHRQGLLSAINRRHEREAVIESVGQLTTCQRQAFGIVSTGAIARAFDLTREDEQSRERYGRNIVGQSLLLARRLVEADVRFVTVNIGSQENEWYWDDHKIVFSGHKRRLAPFDQGFSSLVEDLDAKGMLDETLIVTLGEFGRTPRINKDVGRDHWPDCYCAVLAGGGVRGGSYYGRSDKVGAYPADDPVGPADLAATLFWRFGVDPRWEIVDENSRPYRLAEGKPIKGLFACVEPDAVEPS